ncbi:MAG: cobyric acid synthase [Chloroflexi bacterium]|nr:cobyric acid synthase [Chloroflexota bacterium]
MLQGTASNVGKSLLVAALCRMYKQAGVRVAPFKAQNMALNSFVTRDGLEIGRAQAVQAEAAGIPVTVEMNPILLKPEADSLSQVVVMGKPRARLHSRDYNRDKQELWQIVTDALARLRAEYELVIIEGAGSPAEPNLKAGDIVNMRVARHANAPVLLIGDIDRGGVFASLVGTLDLLEPDERALVRGILINKFRGDVALLKPGLDWLEARVGVPTVGVVPFLRDLKIAEEDSVALDSTLTPALSLAGRGGIDVAVIRLPHISNFDDFDPLALEANVRVRYITSLQDLGEPHAIILPGTKSTLADLDWLNARGFAAAIRAHAHRGATVVGICGGYQMLGRVVRDPDRVESEREVSEGLGLLDVETIFLPDKATHQVRARVTGTRGFWRELQSQEVRGYEIHMGKTIGGDAALQIIERGDDACDEADGAVSADGKIFGTYLHGLFDNANLRRAWLNSIGTQTNADERGQDDYSSASIRVDPRPIEMQDIREREYDRLAAHVRQHVDFTRIRQIAGV